MGEKVKIGDWGQERVLCFPRENLEMEGYFQGVRAGSEGEASLRNLLSYGLEYVDREQAERDECLKQVIPYVVLARANKTFLYQRTKKVGESRLGGKWSVGVGGHINPIDGELAHGVDTYYNGLRRELDEEVTIRGRYDLSFLGLINDDSNEVGRVHFGVVHFVRIHNDGDAWLRDPHLANGKWEFTNLIKKDGYPCEFEAWSRLVIDELL